MKRLSGIALLSLIKTKTFCRVINLRKSETHRKLDNRARLIETSYVGFETFGPWMNPERNEIRNKLTYTCTHVCTGILNGRSSSSADN